MKKNKIDPRIYVGARVVVRPCVNDDFTQEFEGLCIGVRGGRLKVRDSDDDVFEVDTKQVESARGASKRGGVTVADLRDYSGLDLPSSHVRVLHCPECGAINSASRGDYFSVPQDHVFTCECGAELDLVRRIVTVEYV
jgi:hypothetical protein